jgi:methionyl-tRNA formyltransferase
LGLCHAEILIEKNVKINPMRTVFMGSPEFSVPSLESLARISHVAGVVTQPDRPAGRGRRPVSPPVKTAAEKLGIPVIQPERLSDRAAMDRLYEWNPDLVVVIAFGQLLRPNVLNLPSRGCINLHASLLPRHRGAAPVAAAILAGDRETGITLMKMDKGLDTGPILARQSIPILPGDTTESLAGRLSVLAADTLEKQLPVYLRGDLAPEPQSEHLATYAPRLKKEDGRLDFNRPAQHLERMIRAFHPWPGAYTMWKGQVLKVIRADLETAASSAAAGTVQEVDHFPAVQTGDGLLLLREIQLAGKRPMPGDLFLRGAGQILGTVL